MVSTKLNIDWTKGPHSDVKGSGLTCWCCRCLVGRKAEIPMHWVSPPPTNSGILGIHKELNVITVTSCAVVTISGWRPILAYTAVINAIHKDYNSFLFLRSCPVLHSLLTVLRSMLV